MKKGVTKSGTQNPGSTGGYLPTEGPRLASLAVSVPPHFTLTLIGDFNLRCCSARGAGGSASCAAIPAAPTV